LGKEEKEKKRGGLDCFSPPGGEDKADGWGPSLLPIVCYITFEKAFWEKATGSRFGV